MLLTIFVRVVAVGFSIFVFAREGHRVKRCVVDHRRYNFVHHCFSSDL